MSEADVEYETDEWRGESYPAPGAWSLNWVEGDVMSWYHGEKTPDAAYAHLFANLHNHGMSHRLDVDGDEFTIDPEADLWAEVARILAENEPDK